MTEITYLLGAGASFNSMPLVENFSNRFNIFINFLRRYGFNSKEQIIEECEVFLENVESHLSFDTYFKKLFHQNEFSTIKRSKNILLLYFIFEHLIQVRSYNESLFLNRNDSNKNFNIDPRYDALIAGLIRPIAGKNDLFAKTNFITWNYDLNLLFALKNFHSPKETLDGYIKTYNYSLNEFRFSNEVSIFHLNGFVNHPLLKSSKPQKAEDLIPLYNTLIDQFFSPDDKLSSFSKSINFCWETINNTSIEEVPLFILNALEAVKKSDYIIIIGYSFPLYNRYYDTKILGEGIFGFGNKKIILQDPSSVSLEKDFKTIFNFPNSLHKGLPQIIPITNCKSFYVPNNILV